MARPALAPSPSPLTPVKRELDAEAFAAATQTPCPPPPRKKRRRGPLSVTQLQALLTPQAIPSGTAEVDSFAAEMRGQPDLKPATAAASGKRSDAGKDAGRKVVGSGDPYHHGRPTPAQPPTLWANRQRLGRLVDELARAHLWRDAAGVLSTLLRGTRRPASFEEARSVFVAALEIHRRFAEKSGEQLGGRSRYYLRTQKIFDVWMRRLIWLPTCAKKNMVMLELALFYLSQGYIDNAYNATRTLIAKNGLQAEPTLNLIHGLISYDKWYSGLPKDMQLEEFDVYNESFAMSMSSNGCEEIGLQDSSGDNRSMDDDGASCPTCSSESSINNGHIDRKIKIPKKPGFIYSVERNDLIGSQLNEEMADTDFQSVFFNTSNSPTCGLEKSLLPLRLKHAAGTSTDCFDSYWKYKSTPNTFYEDAEKCLRVALHSTPPIMAALLPLIQILLLGDKLKNALGELEKTCQSSTTALPFRLRGRLLEYFDQSQVSTISFCYEEALRRDPTCTYSVERLTKMHRKGYYNTTRLLETIALHLDSASGKPCIWEELVSCFLRLFSDQTTDYEDCISWNVRKDTEITAFCSFSSVFCEQHTRESWKVRCRWWMSHHFSENIFTSETLKGDCKLLASKAACASHLFEPGFQYVKAVESYLSDQEAKDEIRFLSRNMQNSVRLLQSLDKLT